MFERRACAHEANTHTRILPHNCRRQAAPMLCPLWVKSGHMQRKSPCLLWAKSGHCDLFDHLVISKQDGLGHFEAERTFARAEKRVPASRKRAKRVQTKGKSA